MLWLPAGLPLELVGSVWPEALVLRWHLVAAESESDPECNAACAESVLRVFDRDQCVWRSGSEAFAEADDRLREIAGEAQPGSAAWGGVGIKTVPLALR